MRLTIVPEDQCVIKDGDALVGLALPASPNIHAIQWYGTFGVIERIAGSPVQFTDPLVVKQYLDVWQERRDELDAPPPAPPAPTPEQQITAVVAKVQQHLDAVAKARGYDDIKSAATYADEPAVAKFQTEGQALRAWRSLVWAYCYQELEKVKNALRPAPTAADFINELPAAPW
mgnify:FL=1